MRKFDEINMQNALKLPQGLQSKKHHSELLAHEKKHFKSNT